jgi:hypothetical protein
MFQDEYGPVLVSAKDLAEADELGHWIGGHAPTDYSQCEWVQRSCQNFARIHGGEYRMTLWWYRRLYAIAYQDIRALALRIPRAALFDAIPGELLSQRELKIDCSRYFPFSLRRALSAARPRRISGNSLESCAPPSWVAYF